MTEEKDTSSASIGVAKNHVVITSTTQQSPMQAHAVRLGPDTDLVPALLQVAAQAQHETSCAACFVLTAVGSLSQVTLRMASASRKDKQDSNKDDNNDESNEIKTWNERVEIVSMVGTFSSDGSKHLHMSVSRADGSVVGGHVMGGKVFTTLELVLGTLPGVTFTREPDADTGYSELVVRSTTTK